MSIRLITFDLDGTLLDNRKQVSAENREALFTAGERGIFLVPCTARLFDKIPDAVKKLPFVRYVITVNGAEVYDRKEGRVIRRAELSVQEAEALYDYMDNLPVIYDCYQKGQGWMKREFYEHAGDLIKDKAFLRMLRSTRIPVEHFREEMHRRDCPIQKTQMFFGDLKRRDLEMERVKERFPMHAVTSSLCNNIEINSGSATKGAALTDLCGHLGILPSECMALGDSNNDISMLRLAGIGVAMDNASSDVKGRADVVTASNEESGVAKAIRQYAL